jgi:hypothetical protein
MTGSQVLPVVPKTPVDGIPAPNPSMGGYRTHGMPRQSGNPGSPTVPVDGYLFKQGPIDLHYQVENQGDRNPTRKINNPQTRGMWTRLQMFANHIAYNQNTDTTGFKQSGPQQRTSVMRNALPPRANGYNPEWFTPHQNPQATRFNRIVPTVGTDPYGSGVLNTDTFGAGQTAGGVGGNYYTPTPGPPNSQSTAIGPTGDGGSSMPTWG